MKKYVFTHTKSFFLLFSVLRLILFPYSFAFLQSKEVSKTLKKAIWVLPISQISKIIYFLFLMFMCTLFTPLPLLFSLYVPVFFPASKVPGAGFPRACPPWTILQGKSLEKESESMWQPLIRCCLPRRL